MAISGWRDQICSIIDGDYFQGFFVQPCQTLVLIASALKTTLKKKMETGIMQRIKTIDPLRIAPAQVNAKKTHQKTLINCSAQLVTKWLSGSRSLMSQWWHGTAFSCHIRATSNGIKWISMVGFGVRFGRIVWQSFRFTRDYADLRSGFSFAGVAQW